MDGWCHFALSGKAEKSLAIGVEEVFWVLYTCGYDPKEGEDFRAF